MHRIPQLLLYANSAGSDTESFNVVVAAGVPAKPTNLRFVRWAGPIAGGYNAVVSFDEPVNNGSAITHWSAGSADTVGGTIVGRVRNTYPRGVYENVQVPIGIPSGQTRDIAIRLRNAVGDGPWSDALTVTAP